MSLRPALRVIVTRPAAQAEAWVRQLRGRDIDAHALPLIEIAPLADRSALVAAWHELPTRRLVVFVSSNAVLQFFAARPGSAAWPEATTAAAPGGGTADALRAAGCPAGAIVTPAAGSAQLDSESLWLALQRRDWRGARVLMVRGDGGRDWLAERLVEAGATVDVVTAYRRLAPTFDGPGRERLDDAIAHPDTTVWLFSSSEAIGHLAQAAGTGRDWRSAMAIATHPRIAERARGLGFGRVLEAQPGLDAVVACIQSMQP